MAKFRIVNTRFWNDDYTSNLKVDEKLLFLYFLTNTATDICGVYELPMKTIVSDCGIRKDRIDRILEKFSTDGKIFYIDGWVVIKNFTKHQTLNPKVKLGIEAGLNKIPASVMNRLGIEPPYTIDSLSHLNSNSNLNTNTNTNLNSNIATLGVAEVSTNDLIALFEPINPNFERLFANKSQRQAIERMVKKFGSEKIGNTIQALPDLAGKAYAPVITTPLQLESKLGQLISFYYKQKDQKTKIIGL
jgi:hypothetical protein